MDCCSTAQNRTCNAITAVTYAVTLRPYRVNIQINLNDLLPANYNARYGIAQCFKKILASPLARFIWLVEKKRRLLNFGGGNRSAAFVITTTIRTTYVYLT